MEQISFPFSGNLPLKQLVADALGEIERLGYGGKSRRRYRATWEQLIEFARRKGLGEAFSGELAAQFLDEYRVVGQELGPGQGWRRHMLWGVKVLADFAKGGHIDRGRTEVEAIQLVPAMQRTLRDYQQFCKDRLHVRPTTLAKRRSDLTMFLDFLHSKKRRTLEEIQALDLSEFLSCRDHLVPKSVSRLVSDVRSFLRFLTMRGIVPRDLSGALPKIRVPRDAAIPSPLPTIAEILGHTALESTRIYAKADVEALRSVALDPEEVNHVA